MATDWDARKGARSISHSAQKFVPNVRHGLSIKGTPPWEFMQRLSAAFQAESNVLRPAVYAGARVLYDEIRLRTSAMPWSKTGTLHGAIYHWHDDAASTDTYQRYVVGVNVSKARHWFLVEYGYIRTHVTFEDSAGNWHTTSKLLKTPQQIPAYSYLRSSYEAKIGEAMRAIKVRFMERVKDVMAGNV
jgi:hypothetical protein